MNKAASFPSSLISKLNNVDARGGTVNNTGSQTNYYVYQSSGMSLEFEN